MTFNGIFENSRNSVLCGEETNSTRFSGLLRCAPFLAILASFPGARVSKRIPVPWGNLAGSSRVNFHVLFERGGSRATDPAHQKPFLASIASLEAHSVQHLLGFFVKHPDSPFWVPRDQGPRLSHVLRRSVAHAMIQAPASACAVWPDGVNTGRVAGVLVGLGADQEVELHAAPGLTWAAVVLVGQHSKSIHQAVQVVGCLLLWIDVVVKGAHQLAASTPEEHALCLPLGSGKS